MGLDEGITNREILAEGNVPYYNYAEGAIRTLAAMIKFAIWVNTKEGKITKFKVNKVKAKKIFDKVKKRKATKSFRRRRTRSSQSIWFTITTKCTC